MVATAVISCSRRNSVLLSATALAWSCVIAMQDDWIQKLTSTPSIRFRCLPRPLALVDRALFWSQAHMLDRGRFLERLHDGTRR